jgi:hypothetical protein
MICAIPLEKVFPWAKRRRSWKCKLKDGCYEPRENRSTGILRSAHTLTVPIELLRIYQDHN